jgi:hypothetical protein
VPGIFLTRTILNGRDHSTRLAGRNLHYVILIRLRTSVPVDALFGRKSNLAISATRTETPRAHAYSYWENELWLNPLPMTTP